MYAQVHLCNDSYECLADKRKKNREKYRNYFIYIASLKV